MIRTRYPTLIAILLNVLVATHPATADNAPNMANAPPTPPSVTTTLENQLRNQLQQSADFPSGAQIEIHFLGNLSTLPPCPTEWQPEFSTLTPTPGRSTLNLRCPGIPGRRGAGVLIQVKAPVVVIQVPVRSHANIPAENLILKTEDITWLHGNYFSAIAAVADSTARRDLSMGTLVGPQDIAPPLLVHRGDQVIIEATAGSLTVSDVGIALNDAARGETVRIQHQKSGKIVQGFAIGHDVVQIPL